MKSFVAVFLFSLVCITSVFAQDTIQVSAGWNIVGSVKSGTIPEVLITVPDSIIATSFYGYVPGSGYLPTDTLDKGFGYWVKLNAAGLIIFNTEVPPESCSTYLVNYGGTIYTTVQVGDQCWLGENLNVGVMIDSAVGALDNGTIEKYCYGNNPANCVTYGGLYQWDEAMQYVTTPGTQGICPPGWHIPTQLENELLWTEVYEVFGTGNALKAVGQGVGGGAGTDASGFSALLAGVRAAAGGFYYLAGHAFLGSSTELDVVAASAMHLYPFDSFITDDYTDRGAGVSVRCIRD